MDTEHSYYARVLDEVERLQPVGAGGGILVLNLMYPCFEPGARVGMDLSVRSGEDAFPVGTWKVGRPYTNRYIHCPVRTAGRKVSRCGLPLVAPLDRLNGITGLTWTVTVDLPYADDPIRIIHRSLIFDTFHPAGMSARCSMWNTSMSRPCGRASTSISLSFHAPAWH